MKKKIVSLILAICLILPCVFIISACGGNTTPGDISSLSKTELETTFKSIALNSWQQMGAGDPTVEASSANALQTSKVLATNVGDYTLPDEMDEQEGDQAFAIKQSGASMMAYIYMIGEYYANADFVVSNKVVSFSVEAIDPNFNETYTCALSFLPKIYKQDNRVVVEMFLASEGMQYLGYSKTNSYYCFDIGYNFNDNQLISFIMLNVQSNVKNNGENYEEIFAMGEDADGQCFGSFDMSDNAKEICRGIFSDFVDKKEKGLNLTGNFSDEFNRYTDRANRACQTMAESRN